MENFLVFLEQAFTLQKLVSAGTSKKKSRGVFFYLGFGLLLCELAISNKTLKYEKPSTFSCSVNAAKYSLVELYVEFI